MTNKLGELIPVRLERASGVFDNPLVMVLPLFGLAKSFAHALHLVQDGQVTVNEQAVHHADCVLRPGDIVAVGGNGVLVEEQL